MRTAEWLGDLAELTALAGVFEEFDHARLWRGIAPEARSVMLAASYRAHPRKILLVAATYDRGLAWQAKLQLCGVPADRIRQLPSGLSSLFADAIPEHIALSERLGALRALAEDEPLIIIATPQSALERTMSKEALLESFIELKVGDTIEIPIFQKKLQRLGYERQEPVRVPGGFSRRGGILDVFATGSDHPMRIEWFGDEVESIRYFDANTQRSIKTVNKLDISPSRETLFIRHDASLRDLIQQTLEREAAALSDEAAERLTETISSDLSSLEQGVYFDRLDLYRPWLSPDSGSAIDLLGEEDLLVLDEPLELDPIAARAEDELLQALTARAERGEVLHASPLDYIWGAEHLAQHPRLLAMTAMGDVPTWLEIRSTIDVDAVSLDPYRGRAETLTLTLRNYIKDGLTVVISSDQPHRAKTVLSQAEIFVSDDPKSELPKLLTGNLGGGFVIPTAHLAVITDAELFGVARLKLPQKRFMEGAPIATVLDLKPGDYVVHISFGIGIFRGLVNKTIEGVEREFLYIEYQAPDKLFVPADQLDRVQKYLNPSDTDPKLNKLTGGEWQRTLGKAREEAKAFARDLVKLYAQRTRVQRRPYGPDTPFQDEMESTFPWVETPSQLTAIQEAKKDLEKDYPMDRLICGDVGFGKTEVAIRVAFKAVQGGRQVAVLCPTTILSEQHWRNFEERLGSFGTRIGLINRFTTTQEKKQTLDNLKNGEIEILVGTHSLLGKGVEFKDLGLVVIDEEQKFGVKQKEMLKELRTEVDVLTLSATPIPRTLSMALMDIRQMSLINDPPPGRLPIRTFVRPYAGEVIREAILRELARGGQVFYVYNRVESIAHVAEKLRKLVPTARIGVGHGQMTDKELEPIMVGFVKGEIDILLSTTIVENGIDISNANTLIVENADRLGLSQLYQLRGRVGRSDRQAYAYFLYSGAFDSTLSAPSVMEVNQLAAGGRKKKKMTVSEGAMARLQALQEFSALGAGYSLAFRDLQIRGAGELLGAKQSGTMVSVGYELYTQLIQEAVASLKDSVDGVPASMREEVADPLASLEPLPQFDLPVDARLPDTYIKDQAQRLYYYQRMMSARDEITLGLVQGEVEDRYGKPTDEVRNAFTVMSLRVRAKALGLDKVEARGGRLNVNFVDKTSVPTRAFSLLAKVNRDMYMTREAMIWPYSGPPLRAVESMMDAFVNVLDEVERARALWN